MAQTSMKRLGKVSAPAAREMVTSPVSRGCRRTSRVWRLNSGSSSRKRTPLCARLISPGRGLAVPPARPAEEMVWCGARKGRRVTMGLAGPVSPATQADLPGPGVGGASRQAGGGDGVVGRPEGPLDHDGVVLAGEPGDGVDLRGLQHFLQGHGGKDGGQTGGQHALARPRRAGKQHIVAAGHRHFQGALHVLLPLHVGEVRRGDGQGTEGRGFRPGEGRFPPQVGKQQADVLGSVDLQPLGKGGLAGIAGRDKELSDALPSGGKGHAEGAGHGPQVPVQAQLSEKGAVLRQGRKLLRGGQHPQENGQVVNGAPLALVRWGQVHRDPPRREAEAPAAHSCPHPFPCFLHRGLCTPWAA